MNEPDREPSESSKKLRSLLTSAGFTHHAGLSRGRHMVFSGRYREWVLHAFLTPEWFHVFTVVCEMPPEPGLRAELLLTLLRENAKQAMLKFSVTPNDQIVLEFEVRAERLKVDDVRNLVSYVQSAAEEEYLAIVRIAAGESRLDNLSAAFKLSGESQSAVHE